MSFKSVIKAEGKKTREALKPYVDAFEEEFVRTNSELELVTDSSVAREFGVFMHKALGNVNGAINLQKIKNDSRSGFSYFYSSEKPIDGVVTGRRFGFSLQGKSNNYYIDERGLLPGLTSMHVDLIKRPAQRQLARDFFAFKSAYYHRYKSLFTEFNNKVIDVSLPVKVAKIFKVSTSGNDGLSVTVLDEIVNGEVTKIRFNLPEARWIDDNNITDVRVRSKSSLSSKFGLNTNSGVSITLNGTINNEETKFNGFDLHLLSVSKDSSFIKNWFEPDYYNSFKIMNMNDVLKSDAIRSLIDAHKDYNKGVAKTFEYLRLKYAKNLIMNGCF